MGNEESSALLKRALDWMQGRPAVRIAIGLALLCILLVFAGRSLYRVLPREYTITITGGDIVGNRHYLARVLQAEAAKKGITLVIRPVSGSIEALEQVSAGKLDMAFVQGGVEATFPNVEHVATVAPELMHLLVKPEIKGMDDLKGRSVNLGERSSGDRRVGLRVTQFAGYAENIDYVETNYSPEELLGLPPHKMPDAILTVSSTPSYLVELLVRKHHYKVVEIPFPESLALRYGWAANGEIMAYTYDLNPPVPEKNITTVAVNMHLVAHAGADPTAIAKLMEVLYGAAVDSRLRQPLDESRIAVSSGYPPSAGMTAYLERDKSLLTLENWNKATGVFGLIMSFSGMGIVLVKWFRGPPPKVEKDDKEFIGYLTEVASIERRVATGSDDEELQSMRARLAVLRHVLLERYPTAKLDDPLLFEHCLASVHAAHDRLDRMTQRTAS
jgi:TRAP-type uncharacterized transport system substrate-binding protein